LKDLPRVCSGDGPLYRTVKQVSIMTNMILQNGSETTLLWILEVNDSIHSFIYNIGFVVQSLNGLARHKTA